MIRKFEQPICKIACAIVNQFTTHHDICSEPCFDYKHGAALYNDDLEMTIIGINQWFISRDKTLHAEESVLYGTSKKLIEESVLIVIRLSKNPISKNIYEFKESMPCKKCYALCMKKKVPKIIYTTRDTRYFYNFDENCIVESY